MIIIALGIGIFLLGAGVFLSGVVYRKIQPILNRGARVLMMIGTFIAVGGTPLFLCYCGLLFTMEPRLLERDGNAIAREVTMAQLSGTVSDDIIGKIEEHNALCDEYYEEYQASTKWDLFAKMRPSALDCKLLLPEQTAPIK